MNIFFDMDYTLLGVDGNLRPGALDVMRRLKEDGHTLYVWSGAGTRCSEVRRLNLDPLVTDCFAKPLDKLSAGLGHLKLPVTPDLVIDDHPEIAAALGGIWARPYLFDNDGDGEMERLYQIIGEHAKTGR